MFELHRRNEICNQGGRLQVHRGPSYSRTRVACDTKGHSAPYLGDVTRLSRYTLTTLMRRRRSLFFLFLFLPPFWLGSTCYAYTRPWVEGKKRERKNKNKMSDSSSLYDTDVCAYMNIFHPPSAHARLLLLLSSPSRRWYHRSRTHCALVLYVSV